MNAPGAAATPILTGRPVGVVILEDRASIRENVALLIESASGSRCAGSYANMEQALDRIDSRATNVVLVDLILPGMSGVEGIRRLRKRCPDASMLVFTVFEEDERVFDALCAGALGCLPKKAPPLLLLKTVSAVAARGAAAMPPDAARRVLERFRQARGPDTAAPDELRLLELLAEGHNYDTAARELGSTPEGVGRLARSVYRRLHASFRTNSIR